MFESKQARFLFASTAFLALNTDAQAQRMPVPESYVEQGVQAGRNFARTYGWCPTEEIVPVVGSDGLEIRNWDLTALGLEHASERDRELFFLGRGVGCRRERQATLDAVVHGLTEGSEPGTVEPVE